MTLAIRLAIAALSIASITPAFAGEGEGGIQNPAQSAPAATATSNGHAIFVTQTNRGTWLFAPHDDGGSNA
jgi:hypothetical protein